MAALAIDSVRPTSEEACIEWGGEFRGSICVRLEVENGSVRICVRGEARRLGSFDECFDVLDACYTLIDVGVGKLKVCIANIEMQDGLPRCFTLKLVVDPFIGGDITLIEERICLFAVLAKHRGEAALVKNAGAGDDDLVMMLAVNNCKC